MFSNYKKLAIPPLSSDVYLVSYPKSGNTWLRYLLSKVLIEKLNKDRNANWFNLQEFIPDVEVNRFIPLNEYYSDMPRIIKSHSDYNPKYLRVIYLIRNPLEVVESYYYYNLNNKKYNEEDFIKSDIGINGWLKNVESWLRKPRQGQIIKIIRYDSLVNEPLETLRELNSIIGIHLDETVLTKIIRESDKSHMQEDEKKFNSDIKNFLRINFIRDKDDKETFLKKFGPQIIESIKESKYSDRIEFVFEKEISQLIQV